MSETRRRIALMAVLIPVLLFTLGGWPAAVSGQDGDATAAPEVPVDTAAPEVPVDTAVPADQAGTEPAFTGLETATPFGAGDDSLFLPPDFLETNPPESIGDDGQIGIPAVGGPAGPVGIWAEPVNVSKSGAASIPVLAAEPDGTLHALWWDEFDGTKVAYYTPEDGWSEPVTVGVILGGRVVSQGRAVRQAPRDLRVFASSSGWVHAVWLDSKNNLRYARSRSRSGIFALGPTLATNPLAWDVSIDPANDLHLIYVRSDNTLGLPAGVYYRASPGDSGSWRAPVQLVESLYFRPLPAGEAFVQVTSDGDGLVVASWDDAELRRSFYAVSEDGGQEFGEPIAVQSLESASARHMRLFPLTGPTILPGAEPTATPTFGPTSEPEPELRAFLRMWQTGDSCSLYQQEIPDLDEALDEAALALIPPTPGPFDTPQPTDLPGTEPAPTPEPPTVDTAWSDPVRVLDSLGGCLISATQHTMPDGRLLAVLNVDASRPLMTTWNGTRWSEPVGLQISFVESSLKRPVTLGCLSPVPAGEYMAVVGCDALGDVWVTFSQLALSEVMPALTTAWEAPAAVSSTSGDSGMPSVAVDAQGQIFGIVSLSTAAGEPPTTLANVSSDGVNWPGPATVLRASEGQMDMPALAVGPGGVLHVVWSGGYTGQVIYSHAFIRDARVPSGWTGAAELPAPRPVGGWPDLAVGADGVLHAVYAIPLNEDRGVYYTRSEDQGETWLDYHVVFDGIAADWAMIRSTRLALDEAGRLHLVWVRAALPGAGSALGVYYARSDDGGQTWTEPLAVSGLDSDNPRLVVAAPDEIHILWTQATSAGLEIWHRWSLDGGATWSQSLPVQNARRVSAANFGAVGDGHGTIYLTAIEQSRQNAAALLFVRWNGVSWVDRESVPLGYDPAPGSGALPFLLPQGKLGVFYRVQAPQQGGGLRYIVGYIARPVASGQAAPVATFTPVPQASGGAQVGLVATPTVFPTQDVTGVAPPTLNSTVRTQIIIALAVIVLVSGFAIFRLGRSRR